MRNRTVVLMLLAAIVGLAMTASVVHAAPDAFDQGIEVSELLKQAKQTAARPSAKVAPVTAAMYNYERRCESYGFAPDDAPVGPWTTLYSQSWYERCTQVGDPRHGGGRQCWREPGPSYSERVRITLQDRKPLYPWEYDSFEVCLEGPWLDVYARSTAYEYKLVRGGRGNGDYVLTPGKKLRQKADRNGIQAEAWSSQLKLMLKDKWASYYTGETTVLKLTLMQHQANWFDPTIGELELSLPAAERYEADLAAKFAKDLKAGKSYYVKVSFSRLGAISKSDAVKSGETGKVRYEPAAGLVADAE